jgi:alkylation response protein AidB-like acyl-CoA dehydrogenase
VNALDWLQPLQPLLPELTGHDWARLDRLDTYLDQLNTKRLASGLAIRAEYLLEVRRRLASIGYATLTLPVVDGGTGRPAILQALAQFVCGWHDLDLRDATGLGHGALVLDATSRAVRDGWLPRIGAGDLIGIAATERHGGSRIQEITTRAVPTAGRRWLISGEKVWVSRLTEAHGLVVFFRNPDEQISAAIVSATAPGLSREPIAPAGLAGWSWGVLRMDQVPIDPSAELIGPPGTGLSIFREHFARYRPLVTATAIGAAAGVHSAVAQALAARVRVGMLPRVRDNALITLGRAHAALLASLLGTLATVRLGEAGDPRASLWARIGKAHGVDAARAATDELVPLIGAAGFAAASPLSKARADLAALCYADGIHDSLYRSGGKTLLDGGQLPDAMLTTRLVTAEPEIALPVSA